MHGKSKITCVKIELKLTNNAVLITFVISFDTNNAVKYHLCDCEAPLSLFLFILGIYLFFKYL